MTERVEEILGYKFKERSFLLQVSFHYGVFGNPPAVQALTHASYSSNQLTESYERLEFLGDAVLDYLVTAYIFTRSQVDPRLQDTQHHDHM